MNTDLEALKARVNIADVIGETVALKPKGSYLVGLCPFHPHTNYTPSFAVWPETGTWKCFGTCNEGGDVFAFVMKRDGCDFKAALEIVQNMALRPAPARKVEELRKPVKPGGPPPAEWQAVAREVIAQGRKALWSKQGERARAWLGARGIEAATVEAFGIGLHPRPAGTEARKYGAELFGIWVPFGIVIPCVVGSHVWYLKVRTGLDDPKYLNAKGFHVKDGQGYESVLHPALYNADSFLDHEMGMVIESELDAMLVEQDCGDFIGAASLGSNSNELDLAVWARYLVGRTRLFGHYDLDGRSERGKEKFLALSKRIEGVAVPEGKDVTRFRLAHGREGLRRWVAECIGVDGERVVTVRWEASAKAEQQQYVLLSSGEEICIRSEHVEFETGKHVEGTIADGSTGGAGVVVPAGCPVAAELLDRAPQLVPDGSQRIGEGDAGQPAANAAGH